MKTTVLDPMFLTRSGAPRLAFLFRSLRNLNDQMSGSLVVRIGDPVDVVAQVAKAVEFHLDYFGA
jgi:deoxyribodipyrimidine photo-lyase